jgi:hypothetical protein
VLMDNLSLLKECSKDGILSLHENNTLDKGFYIYPVGTNSKVNNDMLDAGKKYFKPRKDGKYNDRDLYDADEEDFYMIKNGLAKENVNDGFDYYFVEKGYSKCGMTTETPGKAALGKRVLCNKEFIKQFIESLT